MFSSSDFYDRQWEQRCLQSLLADGKNILITAPRRVGKTQLAYKLLDWAVREGWLATYANVEHAQTEADFFEELSQAIDKAGVRPKGMDQFKNVVKSLRKHLPKNAKWADGEQSVEIALQSPEEDALHAAETAFDQLLESLAHEGKTLLIGLDELPIFLTTLTALPEGNRRATALLNWFRKVRNAPTLRRVRWLLCGSIGLDTFVEQRSLAGTINDLKPQKLGPFERPTAIEFVKLQASRGSDAIAVSDPIAEQIVDRVGWPLPYYLGLMVEELKQLPPPLRSTGFPSTSDVDAAYASLISPDKKVQFVHWSGRLDLQFGRIEALSARFILKLCSQKPAGTTRGHLRSSFIKRHPHEDPEVLERKLREMITTLERDGYLHSQDDRWAFRSFLLRDYWLRHEIL